MQFLTQIIAFIIFEIKIKTLKGDFCNYRSCSFVCSESFEGQKAHSFSTKIDPIKLLSCATDALYAPVSAAYINLPFCRRRCYYCDFPIKVVGDRPGAAVKQSVLYLRDIKQEIILTKQSGCFDEKMCTGVATGGLQSLYFGGGTPSLVEPSEIALLIELVDHTFGIAPDAEISMEMDPGTFDEVRLGQFVSAGVNRVTLGVQSFDQSLLTAAGRAHKTEDTIRALKDLEKVGVKNVGIDLISGLPFLTPAKWEETVHTAIQTGACHFSIYDLQVEEGTAYGRWYKAGHRPLPSDEESANMFCRASSLLQAAGYLHYEISNYALPGFKSRHNCIYWENKPFLAFGNGAASYISGNRFSRPKSLNDYKNWVSQLQHNGWHSATQHDTNIPLTDRYKGYLLEKLMLGLRLREGICLTEFREYFGTTKVEKALSEVLQGKEFETTYSNSRMNAPLVLYDSKNDRLVLTQPDGYLLSNDLISTLFAIFE